MTERNERAMAPPAEGRTEPWPTEVVPREPSLVLGFRRRVSGQGGRGLFSIGSMYEKGKADMAIAEELAALRESTLAAIEAAAEIGRAHV